MSLMMLPIISRTATLTFVGGEGRKMSFVRNCIFIIILMQSFSLNAQWISLIT